MKRIILLGALMAFAVAVQAGDAKTTQAKDQPSCCGAKMKTSVQAKDQDQPSCCGAKMKTSLQAKEGTCPFAKSATCKQKAVKQTALLSPKATELVR